MPDTKPMVPAPQPPAASAPAVADAVPEDTMDSTESPSKIRLEPTRYGDWELNGKCVDF